MKILYITQYFYPEIGATTNRALANVREMSRKGHDVTVLTEMPNHPKGIIFPNYRGKFFFHEKIENFKVNRVWVYTNSNKTSVTRLLFYISFMLFGTLHTVLHWNKYDIVYVTSPPLFVGQIGFWLKKFFPRVKFVFEVRDLWPDAAIEMGELKNEKIAKLSYKLEIRFYKNANIIISVTEQFKERIINKGIAAEKIYVIRNGSDLSYKNIEIPEQLNKQYQKDRNFIIAYAGNLGIAQNLTSILDAAWKLKKENIIFLFLGSGPEEKKLHEYAKKMDNVYFVGEIPKEKINKYYSLADCGIIPLRNIKVFESTIPSKLFDYMSASLPILLGVKGESKQILEQSEAGICYEPDDVNDLVEKIRFLKNNKQLMNEMKTKGRIFVENNFNRNTLADKLIEILETLIK